MNLTTPTARTPAITRPTRPAPTAVFWTASKADAAPGHRVANLCADDRRIAHTQYKDRPLRRLPNQRRGALLCRPTPGL